MRCLLIEPPVTTSLKASSPYKNAATDGKNIGCDMTAQCSDEFGATVETMLKVRRACYWARRSARSNHRRINIGRAITQTRERLDDQRKRLTSGVDLQDDRFDETQDAPMVSVIIPAYRAAKLHKRRH